MVLANIVSSALTKPVEQKSDLNVKKDTIEADLEQFFRDQPHLVGESTRPQSGELVGSSSGFLDQYPGKDQLAIFYGLTTTFAPVGLLFLTNPSESMGIIASIPIDFLYQLTETISQLDSSGNQTLDS